MPVFVAEQSWFQFYNVSQSVQKEGTITISSHLGHNKLNFQL